jgi:hypothetical protein
MNLSKFSRYLDVLYTDKMNITRYKEVKNENDGTTDMVLDDDPALNDLNCRISSIKEDTNNFDNVNEINSKYKIFCSLNTEIKKGDKIEAHRVIDSVKVETIKGIASKPLKYDLGIEFILMEEGNA